MKTYPPPPIPLKSLTLTLVLLAGFLASSLPAANILYVVNPMSGTVPGNASDREIYNRLTNQGHSVTVSLDNNASLGSLFAGQDLILISSSVGSGTQPLNSLSSSDLRTRNVPIVDYEPGLYDELLLQTATVFGNAAGQTDLYITQLGAGHPLGAGNCEGPLRVTTATGVFSSGSSPATYGSDAILIATNATSGNGDIGRASVWVYEAGTRLADNSTVVPARRVSFYLNATTAAGGYNAAGLALFDAAITWALTPPDTTSAIGFARQPSSVTLGLGASTTFTIGLTGAAPYLIQWQRSDGSGGFTNVPGATCRNLSIGPVSAADHGAQFRAIVSNLFSSATSSVATLRVKQSLLVTGSPTSSDLAVSNRLVQLGFVVTQVLDTASATSQAIDKDLVVISSSVGSGNVAAKFRDVTAPILDWEQAIQDDMDWTPDNATSHNTAASQTAVTIVDCTHPLAAGLPLGDVAIYAAPNNLDYGASYAASAKVIARPVGQPSQACIYYFEPGDLLLSGTRTATSRRLMFFLENNTYVALTAAGQKLFDAAVAWLTSPPNPPNAPIGITSNPSNLTVNEGEVATFSAGFTGAPPYTIQWQRSDGAGGFTNIPGATCVNYLTSPTTPNDNGASFKAVVNNGFSSATSGSATLTVLFDHTRPAMVSAFGSGLPVTSFDLVYSEPVSSEAGDNFSYSLSNGGSLSTAILDADGKTVHFTSDPITNGTILSLTTPITDRAATPNTLNPGDPGSSIAIITTDGSIRRHQFNDIGGGVLVSDLTNNIKFPNLPDVIDYPTLLETAVNAADSYGVQFLGYVTAPVSGNYNLFVCSDDGGTLFLSTDENPANKRLIAYEPVWNDSRQWTVTTRRNALAPENQSSTLFPGGIPLVKGRRYYIEALMKEGGGGDNLGVTWQLPGDPIPANGGPPIPGLYLSRFDQPASIAAGQPADVTTLEGRQATFSVSFSGSPLLGFQWYENGNAIQGATGPSYTTPVLATTDNGKTYFVVISNSFSSATSRTALLTVNPDNNPPVLLSAASANSMDIGLCFDEVLDAATAADPSKYSVNGGAITVTSATLRYDGKTVQLALSSPVTSGFTVTAVGVKDLVARNATPPGTQVNGNVQGLTGIDIGNPSDPVVVGSTFTCRDAEFELIGGGSDVWGSDDHGHFAYRQIAGNFDIRVKIARMDNADPSSKVGLMVRESLDANSRNLHAVVMPPLQQPGSSIVGRNIFETGTRSTTGGATAGWGVAGGANGNLPALHPNSWIRLRRVGTLWRSYVASNGVDWVQNGFSEQLYPSSVYFLLEDTAHNNDGRVDHVLFQQLSDAVVPGVSVNITQNPLNTTVEENHNFSLTAAATASGLPSSELGFQWQRDDGAGGFTNINILGANGSTYTQTARRQDNGATFRVVITLPGASATSSGATLTVTNDITPPRLVSATRTCINLSQVLVVFSEFVDSGSANDNFSYRLDDNDGNAYTINSAALQADNRSVLLSVASPLPDGKVYILTVNTVSDQVGNPIHADSQILLTLQGGRIASGAQNLIVIEAENYDANTPASDGHAWVFQNIAAGTGSFTGTGYMRSLPDSGGVVAEPAHLSPGASPRLDYCVNFPLAGTWRVWLRGNDTVGGANSMHVAVDGIDPANNAGHRIGNTGGASGWGDGVWKWTRDANDSTSIFAAVDVPSPGLHTFSVYMREDGSDLDKILLTTDTSFVLSPNTIVGPVESGVLVTPPPPIRATVTLSGPNITVSWNPRIGVLQQSDNLMGPYTDVPNATNPYTTAVGPGKRFFRLAVP